MLNLHQLITTVVWPILGGGFANGAQNWFKKDDVARSFLHGLVGASVIVIFTYIGHLASAGGSR